MTIYTPTQVRAVFDAIQSQNLPALKKIFTELKSLEGAEGKIDWAKLRIPSGELPIHVAATGKNIPIMQAILDEGLDINTKDEAGKTALHYAISDGTPEMFNFLIKNPNIDAKTLDNNNRTLLHCSALTSKTDLLRSLANKFDIDVNAVDVEGRTALHYAAIVGKLDMVQFLVKDKAAQTSILTPLRNTVFDLTADKAIQDFLAFATKSSVRTYTSKGLTESFNILAQIQADVVVSAIKTQDIQTLNKALVELKSLQKSEKIDWTKLKSSAGELPIHLAFMYGNMGAVSSLIESGADPKAVDSNGRNALHFVARSSGLTLFNLLVDKFGFDPREADNNKRTTLHYAAEGGDLDLLIILVNKFRLDLRAKDIADNNALHHAATYGKVAIMKYLVEEQKFNPDALDLVGRTAVHMAAFNSQFDAVALLVNELGADVLIADKGNVMDRKTASQVTRSEKIKVFLEEAMERQKARKQSPGEEREARLHTELAEVKKRFEALAQEQIKNVFSAIKSKDATKLNQALVALKSLKVDQKKIRLSGDSPIHTAILYIDASITDKDRQIIRVLVANGIDLNAKDDQSFTALHIAAAGKNPNVVQFLVKCGADVNVATSSGLKAVDITKDPLVKEFLKSGKKVTEVVKPVVVEVISPPKSLEVVLPKVVQTDLKTNLLNPTYSSEQIDAIYSAIAEQNIEMLNKSLAVLKKLGGEIDWAQLKKIYDELPIHRAAAQGNAEIIQVLMKENADPKSVDSMGWSALHYAAHNGQIETFNMFVTGGYGLADDKDNDGRTALYYVAGSEHVGMLNVLIKQYNLDPNSLDSHGEIPLDNAVRNRQFEMVQSLVKYSSTESCKKALKILQDKNLDSEESGKIETLLEATIKKQEGSLSKPPLHPDKSLASALAADSTIVPTARRRESSIIRDLGNVVEGLTRSFSFLSKKTATHEKKIVALEASLEVIRIELSTVEGIDKTKVNAVVELVQKSSKLLEDHTADLQKMVNEKLTHDDTKKVLQDALQDKKAQAYYLDVIRLINAVYIASAGVDSGWLSANKSGNLGTFGTVIKIAGGFSPVGASAISALGDLAKIFGKQIEGKKLKKFSRLCTSSDDMNNIAKEVALTLVQQEGKSFEVGQASKDVAAILSAVFADDKIKENTDLSVVASQFVQVVQAANKQKNSIMVVDKAPSASVQSPKTGGIIGGIVVNDSYIGFDYAKRGYQEIKPKNREQEEMCGKVKNRASMETFTQGIFMGIDVDVTIRYRRLIPDLAKALSEVAILNPKFGDLMTNDSCKINDFDMGQILQKILIDEKIIVGKKIDSSINPDGKTMRDIATRFSEAVIKRSNEIERGHF